jgi:hypothetical protein
MIKGFSGSVLLLFAFQVILLVYYLSGSVFSGLQMSEYAAYSVSSADFLRTKAEISIDSVVGNALRGVALFPVDSSVAKSVIDNSLFSELNSTFDSTGLCADSFFGVKKILPLSLPLLASATKFIVFRSGNFVVLKYFVSGTVEGFFPCAEIKVGDYTSVFRLPKGYSQSIMVPLP